MKLFLLLTLFLSFSTFAITADEARKESGKAVKSDYLNCIKIGEDRIRRLAKLGENTINLTFVNDKDCRQNKVLANLVNIYFIKRGFFVEQNLLNGKINYIEINW